MSRNTKAGNVLNADTFLGPVMLGKDVLRQVLVDASAGSTVRFENPPDGALERDRWNGQPILARRP